jgi:hypothetical protein
MGAIDQHVHPARGQFPGELRHGKHQRGGARHVVEHRQAGARSHRLEHRLDNFIRPAQGKRDSHRDHPGAHLPRGLQEHVVTGIVIVAGGKQLIAAAQLERAQHGVDAGRGVGDEDQVSRSCSDEAGHLRPSRFQPLLVVPPEELHRRSFHFLPQPSLQCQDRLRTGAE